ncbi:MAG: hypothetical protein IID61_15975 [SAR324 cluster bacterium]|nr:hypothetical protein [SAR324 cluster bacterium]
MIDEDTIESAKSWCDLGAQWISKKAHSTGIQYIERAIAVFEEAGDLRWLTYSRHQHLNALKALHRDEEVESFSEDVLQGYLRLDDSYGKALVLSHVAESMVRLGRWERAMARLNLAEAVARSGQFNILHAYICSQRARMYLVRDNVLQASRQFRAAEAVLQSDGNLDEASRNRLAAAEALVRLGERSEAIALLEDVQNHLFRRNRYREALQSLTLLSRLYEEVKMWDDKNRVGELIHFCGQYILQGATEEIPSDGPKISRNGL